MKKRNIFSRQAVNFLWVLLGLGAGLQFIEVIWAASKGYLGFFSMMVVVVTEIVITGSIYVIIYKFLIKPCNETRKLFKHFIQSGSFQELIDQDYQIFPEQNEVMQKLDSILDKKNIIELSTKHAELLALQNQINPHFLYNTLESITWMVEAQENEGAVRMISELAKLLRVSLSRGKTIISIKDELQHSRSYMNIQLARYKERFKTEFRIEKEIENYCIVKLVIQPILENAIYYGVGNMDEDEDGRIIVSGEKKEEDILITIEDNGMGMPEEVLEKILTDNSKVPKHGSGVGVINVHSRIRLMFGEKYGLSIESEPDEGTRVTIRIPAIPYTPENAERLESQKYIQRRSADEKESD